MNRAFGGVVREVRPGYTQKSAESGCTVVAPGHAC